MDPAANFNSKVPEVLQMKSMKYSTLEAVIPAPFSAAPGTGVLRVDAIRALRCAPGTEEYAERFRRLFAFYGFTPGENGGNAVELEMEPELGAEAFRLSISASGVRLAASGRNGFLYGIAAFGQMLNIACSEGADTAELQCGEIFDRPRFAYRGFMLDSARRFQRVETVCALLRELAAYRINVFHWHLTDSQGWRIDSPLLPGLPEKATLAPGKYSKEELRSVAALAKELGIRIVPEIDVPGHSGGLLASFPQYACDPARPGKEYCLGNPETMVFLKRIFSELMEIFPDSEFIHLGGDEAETDGWEACPRCRAAMKARGFRNMRELEHAFMLELTRFILDSGRRPVVWGINSELAYPPEVVVQAWLDLREPLRTAPHGNRVIYSIHNSLYFDYPERPSEPHENWMFQLSGAGVYMTDPWIIWKDRLEKCVLGPEACLWTETVPEWRVRRKVLPRLAAYSECAWSEPERKEWYDFLRRRETLESAGYDDFLRDSE